MTTPQTHRRQFLTSGLILGGLSLGGGLLGATAALAEVEVKTITVDQLFPFLSVYLEIPSAERNRFRMAYKAVTRRAKPDEFQLTLNSGGKAVDINIDQAGYLTPLPSLSDLKAKAPLTIKKPAGSGLGISLNLVSTLPLSPVLDAKELGLSVTQAAQGAKRAAGLLAFGVPRFDRALIMDVASATVVLANGESKALPWEAAKTIKDITLPRHAVFVPADWPTAVQVKLDQAPKALLIDAKS